MDPPLHPGVKSAVSWVDSRRWKPSKLTKDINISRQGILLIDYLEKGRTFNNEYYVALLMRLKEEISHKWRRKNSLSPRQCTVSRVDRKLHELHFELLLRPLYSPDLAPATTGCLQTSKKKKKKKDPRKDLAPLKKWYRKPRCILRSKKNRSTKKGIELLEKHWDQCITLQADCEWIKSNFA